MALEQESPGKTDDSGLGLAPRNGIGSSYNSEDDSMSIDTGDEGLGNAAIDHEALEDEDPDLLLEDDYDSSGDEYVLNDNGDADMDDSDNSSDDIFAGRGGNFASQDDYNRGFKAQKDYKRRKKRAFLREAQSRKNNPMIGHNLSQGNEAYVNRNYDEAFKYFSEVIRLDPKNVLAYRNLGDIASKKGKKNDCCTYWYFAAVNSQWDGELWAMVGELSAELGHMSRAIQAYGKAISLRTPNRNQLIYERAMLYKETNQFGRALDGFRKLCHLYPSDSRYIKDLAEVYLEDRRVSDAVNLYMDLLHKNMNQPNSAGIKFPTFAWQELNILLELYVKKRSWRLALKVFKLAARFIQGRSDEEWWDEVDNDAEFDERRFEVLKNMPTVSPDVLDRPYDLLIDLCYKLGQIRLELGYKDEAIIHFDKLLEQEDISICSDLILGAGKALELHGFYEEALKFLERAHLDYDEIVVMGTCYLELGQYDEACRTFEDVLEVDPDDINVKISLAEALYHLGETNEAKILLDEVSEARKKTTNEKTLEDGMLVDDPSLSQETNEDVLFKRSQKKPKDRLTDEQRQEIEELAKRKVMDDFRRMQRLEPAMIKGESVAIDTWLQLANRLIEIFTSVPNFFPRDKSRTFKGIVLYRRRKPLQVDERIARVYNLYEGIPATDLSSRLFLTSEKEYRGLKYDDWFMIFLQHALLSATFKKNLESAAETIEIALDVNVFVQDQRKEAMIKMIRLIFGVNAGEFLTTVMQYIRYFLMANQFSPFIYKFFLCCFPSGINAWDAFGNYNHQKFFLRQLKAYDSIIKKEKPTGMATITADIKNCKLGQEHAELLYVYSNLLGSSRSFLSPIVYLNRAYNHYSKDPMICFTLGLAHVHRSMQRSSSNRHMHLLQGISYVTEYRELRLLNSTVYEKQEVEFNMGRLFHMIGLLTEAINHYDKALEFHEQLKHDPDHDLLMEVAYNLTLIYNINGNSQLAYELTEKYLTI